MLGLAAMLRIPGGELASSGAGSSGLGIRRRGGGGGVVDDAAVAVAEPRSVARKRSAGVLGGAEDPGRPSRT